MKLIDLLARRRSVRCFKPEPPSDELVREVLRAATLAPSASNKQPWRFFVVKNRSVIATMAAAVRVAVEEIAQHVPADSEAAFRAYGDYFTRFEAAPVVIVPIHRGHAILSQLADPALPAGRAELIRVMERDSGLVGTSLALMNLLLAAHDLGLGASGMTGPLIAADALKTILGVPSSWGIVALVPIGYPDETPKVTQRKDVERVIRWIR
jgi:nitroreductase